MIARMRIVIDFAARQDLACSGFVTTELSGYETATKMCLAPEDGSSIHFEGRCFFCVTAEKQEDLVIDWPDMRIWSRGDQKMTS